MDESYIAGLSREERAAWGFQVFIRLWLSGMCQSQAAQNWTIAQIAILFEVTQGHLFREEAHTATSLSNELNLPIQTVSRTVRELQKMGLIKQQEASEDARKKYLYPSNVFFARDAMGTIIQNFGREWFHGWDQLDKAHGAEWYRPMSQCSDSVAREEIRQFKGVTKAD
ncbi:MAG: helix-turn-helix domain-containing protein [Gammaproteobacteria bacterium]|nr:helix-turn-helix domain-containing protein [Gammaproteobacteria bacterium]